MKPHRLPSKEYEELLAIMRRWPDPYRAMIAKIIHHVAWQFEQIKKLEEELRHFKQQAFFEEKKLVQARSKIIPPVPQKTEKYPLAKRLKIMIETNATDSKEWGLALKMNQITHETALKMGSEYVDHS